jgi:hypothetical protein
MNAIESIPVLNQLFALLSSSLPMYLADVKTLAWPEGEPILAALGRLVADQRLYAQRVSEAITELGGRPNPGSFPTEFTSKNDLSLAFLLPIIIDSLCRTATTIEQSVGRLEGDATLHAMAEEILGNTKGHLDILVEMMKDR